MFSIEQREEDGESQGVSRTSFIFKSLIFGIHGSKRPVQLRLYLPLDVCSHFKPTLEPQGNYFANSESELRHMTVRNANTSH